MNVISYEKLMNNKPTKIDELTNQKGQLVEFYEDPIEGDNGVVIGVIDKVSFYTHFFDTEDFYQDSDYNPIMMPDRTIQSAYDVEL